MPQNRGGHFPKLLHNSFFYKKVVNNNFLLKVLVVLNCLYVHFPFRIQQSACPSALLLVALQLSLPQTRPVWQSESLSQSPPFSPHLLRDEQQLHCVASLVQSGKIKEDHHTREFIWWVFLATAFDILRCFHKARILLLDCYFLAYVLVTFSNLGWQLNIPNCRKFFKKNLIFLYWTQSSRFTIFLTVLSNYIQLLGTVCLG